MKKLWAERLSDKYLKRYLDKSTQTENEALNLGTISELSLLTNIINKLDKNLKTIDKIIDDDTIKDSVRDNLLKEKAYFISNKLYALLTTEEKVIIKAKGVDYKYLKFEDFVSLHNYCNNIDAYIEVNKYSYKRDYSKVVLLFTKKQLNCLIVFFYMIKYIIMRINGLTLYLY